MSQERPGRAEEMRKRAEALLAKSPESFQPADLKNIACLAHELARHQVELELQNEELLIAQSSLRLEIESHNQELSRSNERLEHIKNVLLGIRQVNHLVACEEDPGRLIEQTCLKLTETMGYFNVWIALLGGEAASSLGLPDQGKIAGLASAGFDGGFEKLSDRLNCGEFSACLKKALMAGEVIVTADPVSECPDCPLSGQYGGRASLTIRLEFNGITFGILTASVPAAYADNAEEQELFKDLAGELSLALHNMVLDRRRWQGEERIALLGRMLDEAPAGITILDAGGRFIFSNRQNMLLHGYQSEEEFLAVNLHQLDVPEDEKMLDGRFARISAEGEARFEVQHFKKDGTILPLEVTAKAIDWHGRPAVLSIAIDITERRQMEKAIRESEDRFQKMLSLVPDMISIHDKDLNILYSNWNGFGAVPEENRILKTKCFRTYRGYDSICPDCQAKTVLETRKTYRAEAKLPNGMWIDLRVIPMLDEQGQVESFVEWVKDITTWKQAEETLRESEEKHRRLFETMSQGVVYQSGDLEILSVNPAAERILALSSAQMLGKTSINPGWKMIREDGSQVSEQEHPAVMAMRTGQTIGPLILGLFHPGRNDFIWLNITAIPLFRKGETKPYRVYSTFEDISKAKKAEAEREKLQAQLNQAQKMESVGRLAGGVAHDFNNMLGVILGYAEMLLEDLGPDNPWREKLLQISKAAERSANLTRQLLAFARKQTIAPKVLDVNDTISSMLKMLERLIGEDIDLLWKPGRGLSPVRIDPGQLDQILANLLVNARDAISHDRGKVTIETAPVALDQEYCSRNAGFMPGAYVLLAVSDNGCGMDKATMSHIFEPFFTTKEVGQGTGLGLAMIYGIVKQNNGFINVYSEPGRGSTFKIYLPRHSAMNSLLADEETDKPARPAQETILLVEDEAAIREMTGAMLKREGYTVLSAGTPAEAIQLTAEHRGTIDLLILDVVMPGMNGRELAEKILAVYPQAKCLFMSGYTANVIAHHGILDQGVNFIQKPFSKAALNHKLRDVLDRT